MKLLTFCFLFCISLTSFASFRPDEDNLYEKFAKLRKSQIKDVQYVLEFEFEKKSDEFKGKSILKVELNHLEHDLSIDAFLKQINEIKINGKILKKYTLRKHSLDIPRKDLNRKMEIEISYIGNFSKTSSGFKHITDPIDGEEYIYSDFEPYYAHWLFPSFDQPDLKATFQVTVKAPSDWKVVHNELVEKIAKNKKETITIFRPTPKLSPYLFFLGLGPYVEWTDKFEELPLVLYARKSVASNVDEENIFETTKKGLRFFNDYFGYKYPFSKYGQIFVPEFAWSGMENPGAVTLNERFIFRGAVSKSRIEDRESLILHEMAHMWFGDLVTMEWWNDLWLNESFATYLASVGMERALNLQSTWLDFFSTKSWGYWQDQLITTHPIETDVPDIRTAKGNFDGITYAKGASALKQLHFFVGDEGFKDGLDFYFKKYAFQNTIRKDFIDSIAKASKIDLNDWTKKWLQTSGPSKVEIKFECKNNKITSAQLIQSKNVSGNYLPHRTRIAFFVKASDLKISDVIDLVYKDRINNIPEAKGKACPDFVYGNYQDFDYALYSLDKKSLENVEFALMNLSDPFVKLMLWKDLAQMVRDLKLTPEKYFQVVLSVLEKENDEHLLGQLIGGYSSIRSYFNYYLTLDERSELAPKLEELFWKKVAASERGSNLQLTYFDFFVSIAHTPDFLDKLHDILKNDSPPRGISLDQDRRWNIIATLASGGHKNSLKLIEEEELRDQSTLGVRMAYASRVSLPKLELKKKEWQKITGENTLSFSDLRAAAGRFFSSNYPGLVDPFVKDFFDKITTMDWKVNDSLIGIYFDFLFPSQSCSSSVLKLSERKFKSSKNLTNLAKRNWLEANDELKKCVSIRENSAKVP